MSGSVFEVVCFSNVAWDALWQRHQALMSRMASRGHQVVFVESIGIRRPRLTSIGEDVRKAWSRAERMARRVVRGGRSGAHAAHPGPPGLEVLSLPVLPLPGWRPAERFNAAVVNRALRSSGRRGVPIFWFYYPSRALLDVAAHVRPALVVYDCVLPFAELPGAPPDIASVEADLLRRADLVLADSKDLVSRLSELRPDTLRLPPGVDTGLFLRTAASDEKNQPAAASAGGEGPPRSASGRPVVGYFGGFGPVFDCEAVGRLAAERPDVHFLFIGPAPWPRGLSRYPNVEFRQPVPHAGLPALATSFTVCLLPYRADRGHATFPTKFFEYLATGKPVVASALPDLVPYGHLVELYPEPSLAPEALARALRDSGALAAERRAVAAENDWDRRVDTVLDHLETVLAAKRGRRRH